MRRVVGVFVTFLRLGCTSFGGPVAHLAYFRREFVERRTWLDDAAFAQCVALTQLLPGPGSSQTGMLIGWLRAGFAGALAAWIAFTLPSAAIMTALALLLRNAPIGTGWLHALLLVAAAVVASALVALRASLAPDGRRLLLAFGAMLLVLAWNSPFAAPVAIGAAACAGVALLAARVQIAHMTLDLHLSRRSALLALGALALAFVALSAWAATGTHPAVLAATLFRVGSLVFGGGHVVLPLLQTQAVAAGIVNERTTLAAYAAAQAMPGPLFTIASFIGAASYGRTLGITGALIGTLAIFAPSFFLLAGIAPFYRALSESARFRAALAGANAAVVGLLGAAFVNPILRTAVRTPIDALAAIGAFVLLHYLKAPAWALVIVAALIGLILERS